MLNLMLKNQRYEGGHGFTFRLQPFALSLRSLAFSLFFILYLLNANTLFAGTVTLSWDVPTTNTDGSQLTDLAGYKVYYGTSSGSYNQSIDVGNVTTYTLNLTDGTTYYFTVITYNSSKSESGYSNEVCRTIGTTTCSSGGDTQAPTVPTGLSAQAISSSQINLSWTASTDNVAVTGYRIYRCLGSNCSPTTQLATSATNSYSNTGLSASTAYTYRVLAYDAAGNVSSQSSSASATTSSGGGGGDTQAPTVPTGLSAQAISSSQINLSWTASTDNVAVTGYRIYRCLGSNCSPTTQIDTSATNSYSNTGLSASTTYTYSVSAYDAAGNASSQSSSVSATTSNSGGGGGSNDLSANNTGSGSEISGGGCGFVKDDNGNGKGSGGKGQETSVILMLIIALAGIAAARKFQPKRRVFFD